MLHYDYVEATTKAEALEILSQNGPDARPMAGGTDLLMAIRHHKIAPRLLFGILEIPELCGLRPEGDGIWVGAATTHHELTTSPLVRERFPLLALAAGKVGSSQIRAVATVGGNLCNAAVCADTAPSLLALDAVAEIQGPGGVRLVPLEGFFTGPGRTVVAANELLMGLHLPGAWRQAGGWYIKHAWRNALDIQMVGAAVTLDIDRRTLVCRAAHVALGTSAPTPLRMHRAEEALVGHHIDESVARQAGEIAAEDARPRSSNRASAEYRRAMIPVLVQRAALEALHQSDAR